MRSKSVTRLSVISKGVFSLLVEANLVSQFLRFLRCSLSVREAKADEVVFGMLIILGSLTKCDRTGESPVDVLVERGAANTERISVTEALDLTHSEEELVHGCALVKVQRVATAGVG